MCVCKCSCTSQQLPLAICSMSELAVLPPSACVWAVAVQHVSSCVYTMYIHVHHVSSCVYIMYIHHVSSCVYTMYMHHVSSCVYTMYIHCHHVSPPGHQALHKAHVYVCVVQYHACMSTGSQKSANTCCTCCGSLMCHVCMYSYMCTCTVSCSVCTHTCVHAQCRVVYVLMCMFYHKRMIIKLVHCYMYMYMTVVGSSPTRGSSIFLEKVTALGVLCCFALFDLACFFLSSFSSLIQNMYIATPTFCTCIFMCTLRIYIHVHLQIYMQAGSMFPDTVQVLVKAMKTQEVDIHVYIV